MWPAAAGHTHSGGRERLIFGVLRVFRVKSTGQRARERERELAGEWIFAVYFSEFWAGDSSMRLSPSQILFPTFTATDQFRSVICGATIGVFWNMQTAELANLCEAG